jgi:predicted phage tail protein
MSELITLAEVPYFFKPEARKVSELPWYPGLTVGELTAQARADLAGKGFTDFYISKNGHRVLSLDEKVSQGDFVAISIRHGFQALTALIWVGLYNMGMYAGINIAAYAISTAVVIGAGMLLNSFMSPPKPSQPKVESPSYGFEGQKNGVQAGMPVPVVYGNVRTTPQIIGAYRTLGDDYSVWQYLLLACTEGESLDPTSHLPLLLTADKVWIGDEKLTSFEDYVFNATPGSLAITDTIRDDLSVAFEEVHHDRPFDKRLKKQETGIPIMTAFTKYNVPVWVAYRVNTLAEVILPTTLNGVCFECTTAGTSSDVEPIWDTTPGNTTSDGDTVWTCRTYSSIPVLDDSGRGAPWTLNGGASVSLTSPKWGNGSLSCPADGDYCSTDDFESLQFNHPSEVEFWLKLPNLSDRILFGQTRKRVVSGDVWWDIYSFGYMDGKFCLQSLTGKGTTIDVVVQWYIRINLQVAHTPPTNTWFYVRLQCYTGDVARIHQILVEDDGELVLLGSEAGITPSDNSTITDYDDETAAQKANFTQQIGKGYFYDTTTEIISTVYAHASFDCFRFCRGLAHEYDDRSIPDAELGEPTALPIYFTITTKNKANGVNLLFEFPYGQFLMTDEGDFANLSVWFAIDYRLTSGGAWTEYDREMASNHSTVVRHSHSITFPTRDRYDVRIARLTDEDGNDGRQRSVSYLIGFDEIINKLQCFPGIQVIALGVKSSDRMQGQLGTVTVEQNRTCIAVPNWTDTGIMYVDPTNPAWGAYASMTNPYSGRRISPLEINQTAWEDWADYCDELVDGYRRCQLNIVFDEPGDFGDNCLAHIEQVGRARIIRLGSQWTVIVDKPKSNQYVFSSGNMIKDSFEWSSYDETEKTDAVEIVFWDSARSFHRNSYLAKSSGYESLTRQPNVVSIELRGCNNLEQAKREAILRMRKTQYLTRHGKHSCGMEAALVEVGDPVQIIHPTQRYAYGGRLAQDVDSSSTVTLDQYVTLNQTINEGKLYLFLMEPVYSGSTIVDYQEASYLVTGPWGTSTCEITVDGTIKAKRFDTWALGRPNQEKLAYQILNKRVSGDLERQEVEFEWIEYNEDVFYHPSYGEGEVPI